MVRYCVRKKVCWYSAHDAQVLERNKRGCDACALARVAVVQRERNLNGRLVHCVPGLDVRTQGLDMNQFQYELIA